MSMEICNKCDGSGVERSTGWEAACNRCKGSGLLQDIVRSMEWD